MTATVYMHIIGAIQSRRGNAGPLHLSDHQEAGHEIQQVCPHKLVIVTLHIFILCTIANCMPACLFTDLLSQSFLTSFHPFFLLSIQPTLSHLPCLFFTASKTSISYSRFFLFPSAPSHATSRHTPRTESASNYLNFYCISHL